MILKAGGSHNARAHKMPESRDPEFPARNQTPGPDDVYDPDYSRRDNSNTYGPYYFDTGRDGDGGGSLVLF